MLTGLLSVKYRPAVLQAETGRVVKATEVTQHSVNAEH